MSNFINLDSIWRDREAYPNENSFEVSSKQVDTWFRSSRTVRTFSQNPNRRPLEFATTVNIKHLILPYTEDLVELPVIYVNFRSKKYNDIHLINAIYGKQPTAKFICTQHKILNDKLGSPLWIHYQCNMEQTMRFERGGPVIFQITTRDGSILPQQDTIVPLQTDPTKQSICTFELTPYIRDGDYDNHMVSPLQK